MRKVWANVLSITICPGRLEKLKGAHGEEPGGAVQEAAILRIDLIPPW